MLINFPFLFFSLSGIRYRKKFSLWVRVSTIWRYEK
jgi:hypothetical protein